MRRQGSLGPNVSGGGSGIGGPPTVSRGLSSIRGAGYSSSSGDAPGRVDLGTIGGVGGGRGPQASRVAPPLTQTVATTPIQIVRELDKKVNKLIEDTAFATAKG